MRTESQVTANEGNQNGLNNELEELAMMRQNSIVSGTGQGGVL